MKRIGLAVMLLGGLAARPALADQAAADACARQLPADASMVYRDAAPDMTKTAKVREVLTAHVRRMVFEGRIKLSDARPAATAAAVCLQDLQN